MILDCTDDLEAKKAFVCVLSRDCLMLAGKQIFNGIVKYHGARNSFIQVSCQI